MAEAAAEEGRAAHLPEQPATGTRRAPPDPSAGTRRTSRRGRAGSRRSRTPARLVGPLRSTSAGIFEFGLISTKPLPNWSPSPMSISQASYSAPLWPGAEQLLEHDRDLHAVGRAQRIELQRMPADRQFLVVRRPGDRPVDVGEPAAARLVPGPDLGRRILGRIAHSVAPIAIVAHGAYRTPTVDATRSVDGSACAARAAADRRPFSAASEAISSHRRGRNFREHGSALDADGERPLDDAAASNRMAVRPPYWLPCCSYAVSISASAASEATADDPLIAQSLAEMLRDARTVVSNNQDLINNPEIGDKGLTGKSVLDKAMRLYKAHMGVDPARPIRIAPGTAAASDDGVDRRGRGRQSGNDQRQGNRV